MHPEQQCLSVGCHNAREVDRAFCFKHSTQPVGYGQCTMYVPVEGASYGTWKRCDAQIARQGKWYCDTHLMKQAAQRKVNEMADTKNQSYLADYVEVKDRIGPFWEKYPNGRIQNETIELAPDRVTVKCSIYADRADEFPIAEGHSWMKVPGTTNFTRGSEIENTETSAVGRALAFLGIGIDKSIASKNEIANKAGDTSVVVEKAVEKDPNAATSTQLKKIRSLAESVYGKASWKDGLYEDHGVSTASELTKTDADNVIADLEAVSV